LKLLGVQSSLKNLAIDEMKKSNIKVSNKKVQNVVFKIPLEAFNE